MESTIRLFVAAALPDSLGPVLQAQLYSFKDETLREMPPQNLHLTLFFIGNAPTSDLQTIQQQVKTIAQQSEAFTLQLAAIEQGPKPNSPRLVWARFKEEPEFTSLSKKLAATLAPDEPNKLKPTPHITLARYRKNTKLILKPAILPGEPIMLPVSEIALWESRLASPHPVYSILQSYKLG